ncbi:iron uptake transporter deferrochelatase/peroxidase subunit [Frigidibacter sp. MR17.24]|uniref:iron uptake transporter deferrochelatase/peroxidase subunit n=1 Tax=Frigidibacter sp. MR17.24 TaxID=3127345 RepID=UPI003012D0D1
MADDTPAGFRPSRRGLLAGAGALAVGCPFAAAAASARVADAPAADRAAEAQRVPPFGPHQAGIVTPRPANGLVASFDVLAESPEALERLLRRLTERIAFLTRGGATETLDPRLPPADSGILGPEISPDALTITVSLGASLFADRDWLAPLAPRQLRAMDAFPNDALDARQCHGDIAVQICANGQDTVLHALRDIIKQMPDQMILRWMQAGSVPVVAPAADGTTASARNLMGFRDGSANPDSAEGALMDRVVWAGAPEPAWARGGSYQVVRLIRMYVERWDRTPLREQERDFGRTKITGAPLDRPGGTEADVPDYAADPEGRVTPLGSHIRRANPRTADTARNLILRRPFNYANGVTRNGQLDQGLLFICWQADLQAGFVAVQNRLNGEPMEEYFQPVGGGYFFALPGIRDADDFLGSQLVRQLRQPTPDKA